MRYWMMAIALLASILCAADLSGKWDFVWQTPGGERRNPMVFTVDGENVTADIPGNTTKITGTLRENKLTLSGTLYSPEAGQEGKFKLEATLEGEQLKGSASWEEHHMTFTATKAKAAAP